VRTVDAYGCFGGGVWPPGFVTVVSVDLFDCDALQELICVFVVDQLLLGESSVVHVFDAAPLMLGTASAPVTAIAATTTFGLVTIIMGCLLPPVG
jgi:hypothetical protein